jgi:DNA-binding winged helix-turn-helix (wHTH) protein
MESADTPPTNWPALSQTDCGVLHVLLSQHGRIISRDTIQRMAGLDSVSARRVDASIVVLRRILGTHAVITVRRRGWMLADDAVAASTELLARHVDTAK